MPSSEYQILKVLIYLTRVDGKVHKLEELFIKDKIKKIGFTEQEQLELIGELHSPTSNFIDSFKLIENYRSREVVLGFARHLFHLDDEFHTSEKKAYDQMKSYHDDISQDIQSAAIHAGSSILDEKKKADFMEEVNVFGEELGKKRGLLYRYLHTRYPSLIFYSLYKSGSIGRKFSIFLMICVVIFIMYRINLFL